MKVTYLDFELERSQVIAWFRSQRKLTPGRNHPGHATLNIRGGVLQVNDICSPFPLDVMTSCTKVSVQNIHGEVKCEPCLLPTVHEATFFCTVICRFQERVKLALAFPGAATPAVAATPNVRSDVTVNASCGLLSGKNSYGKFWRLHLSFTYLKKCGRVDGLVDVISLLKLKTKKKGWGEPLAVSTNCNF